MAKSHHNNLLGFEAHPRPEIAELMELRDKAVKESWLEMQAASLAMGFDLENDDHNRMAETMVKTSLQADTLTAVVAPAPATGNLLAETDATEQNTLDTIADEMLAERNRYEYPA
ncbi:MAG TPA: hypothetical protein VK978_04455 [Candidatus Saccharimonadales bacterium]|nr:hypothetical protein [Candidatus Saccharimonadales bacterium]